MVTFASDSALLVNYPGEPSVEVTGRVLGLFHRLRSCMLWRRMNLHPAYCSLLVEFDPYVQDPKALHRSLGALAASSASSTLPQGRTVEIPVVYGNEFGPDLEDVSKLTGWPSDTIIQKHTDAEFMVAFLGFSPGFPYLLGLPQELACPRKATPRLRVPKGSVAIAGFQAGIYPGPSPGGWQVIGRTDVSLYGPDSPGAAGSTLLEPGDRVKFRSVTELKPRPPRNLEPNTADPILQVVHPGAYITVQDGGTDGFTHLGISPSGAADTLALRVGNALLGNSRDAAALECTLSGGAYRFLSDTWIAITGSPCTPRLEERVLSMGCPHPVSAGQVLHIGPILVGLRSYICVRGGLYRPSENPLNAGDKISAGERVLAEPSYRPPTRLLRRHYEEPTSCLHITQGPQWDWFTPESRDKLLTDEFTLTEDADRRGLRLSGPALTTVHKDELISEGIANGAVQVSGDGKAMILFCEQRTTGGYPKIANVIRADLWRLGQLRPGTRFQFKLVTLERAWHMNREWREMLKGAGYDPQG